MTPLRRSTQQLSADQAERVFRQWTLAAGVPTAPVTRDTLEKFSTWLLDVAGSLRGQFNVNHYRLQMQVVAECHQRATGEPLDRVELDEVERRWRDRYASEFAASTAPKQDGLRRRHIRALLRAVANDDGGRPAAATRATRDELLIHLLYTCALEPDEIRSLRAEEVMFLEDGTVEIVIRSITRRIVRMTGAASAKFCGPCAMTAYLALVADADTRTVAFTEYRPRTHHVCVRPQLGAPTVTGYLMRSINDRHRFDAGCEQLSTQHIRRALESTSERADVPEVVRRRITTRLLRDSRIMQCAVDTLSDDEVRALFGSRELLVDVQKARARIFPWIEILIGGQQILMAPRSIDYSDRGGGL